MCILGEHRRKQDKGQVRVACEGRTAKQITPVRKPLFTLPTPDTQLNDQLIIALGKQRHETFVLAAAEPTPANMFEDHAISSNQLGGRVHI